MKKTVSLILALVMCLSLCACSGANNTTETTQNGNNIQNTEDGSRIEIAYPNPVTILDNEFVKVVATVKFSDYDKLYKSNVMGYVISIENKTEQYINFAADGSIDGYMVGQQDGPYFDPNTVAPGMKANATLVFFVDRMTAVKLETLEDLKNVDGLVQIGFSKDGNGFSNHVKVPFANILP